MFCAGLLIVAVVQNLWYELRYCLNLKRREMIGGGEGGIDHIDKNEERIIEKGILIACFAVSKLSV